MGTPSNLVQAKTSALNWIMLRKYFSKPSVRRVKKMMMRKTYWERSYNTTKTAFSKTTKSFGILSKLSQRKKVNQNFQMTRFPMNLTRNKVICKRIKPNKQSTLIKSI